MGTAGSNSFVDAEDLGHVFPLGGILLTGVGAQGALGTTPEYVFGVGRSLRTLLPIAQQLLCGLTLLRRDLASPPILLQGLRCRLCRLHRPLRQLLQ